MVVVTKKEIHYFNNCIPICLVYEQELLKCSKIITVSSERIPLASSGVDILLKQREVKVHK
jgi:hypothetical protein